MGKLTVFHVRAAKNGRHCDGDGLYLMVNGNRARSWVLRIQHQGRRRDIGLGSVDLGRRRQDDPVHAVEILRRKVLTLAEARDKAAILRRLTLAGLDPVAERDREVRRIPTFAQAVDLAHAELSRGWTAKHAADFKSTMLSYAIPTLGSHSVDIIDHAMIRATLAPVWTDKPSTAKKVFTRINQVLAYCHATGLRTQDVPQKQVVRRGLARQSQSQHHPAVPFRQVPLFMHDLLGGTESSGRLALAFAALTASRSGEVRQATWDQIDLDTKIWSKPAHIMKSRRASSIPLSEAALVILRRAAVLRGKSHVVFPGRSGALLNNGALRNSMLAQGWGHATVHGLRSSFRDWAAEEMPAIPAMVAELILSHSVLSQTERAYLRSDLTAMRRTLMEAWAAFIMPQPEKPASGASAPCSGPLTIDR